jgi:inward rectifier potassium channel
LSTHKTIEKDNTGFSNLSTHTNTRMVNADGSINVVKIGQSFFDRYSLYRVLIVTSWAKFILFILTVYLAFNVLFAVMYYLIGVEHLGGVNFSSEADAFLECFFFSSQTFTTVGYGRISPIGLGVNIIASLEAFVGVLIIAVFTGLLYGRFSRPVVKIIKSSNAVITNHKNGKALMFRIVNAKNSVLSDAEVEIRLSILKEDSSGIMKRRYYELKTEIKKITLFTLSWTVVHPITEDSPFWEMTEADMEKSDAEIIILFRAFEDTFSQNVNSWLSYKNHEIVWNAKFKSIIDYQDNTVSVDLSRIDAYEII